MFILVFEVDQGFFCTDRGRDLLILWKNKIMKITIFWYQNPEQMKSEQMQNYIILKSFYAGS